MLQQRPAGRIWDRWARWLWRIGDKNAAIRPLFIFSASLSQKLR
jgi:hypothetical protein